jgi:tetratricopeptide (TPR) repeat protein
MRYILCLLLLLSFSLNAQHVSIKEVVRPMKTYPYSDPDPVARPGRVYPYFRFNGFTNKSITRNWNMIELENDYIKLAVTPEIGGKVWEAYEKASQFPFIFCNSVVKFRNVALRGAWTSGGLEFNFGDYGHATTTSTPVDYFIRTNPDGSASCFIGATEWSSRTTWRVEIRLDPDKAYFTTSSWWYNNTPVEQELYHWINAGFRAPGDLEFIFPGTHYIGHGGEFDTWPLDSLGRKISFYEENDFGGYKSYHVLGRPTDFYGGYWHKYNMGFGHYSPYYEKLGKKAWSWGLSRQGLLWETLLTDTDGPNVELQSGRLFNQASAASMRTPFKHVGFAPYAADTWTDYWFPVKQTKGITNASPRGALNLRIENNWLKVDWMSLENQSDTLKVLASGSPVISRSLVLKPMEVFRDSIPWKGNPDDLVVRLGQDVLTDDPGQPLNRPLKTPDNFDWQSEYGLVLRGADLSRQKNYSEAEIYLMQALEKNPNLLPALTQMAQIRYRQGLYDEAREFAGRALSINTYDAEANYFWGISSEETGYFADALDGFSVAALSPAFRQAAYLHIAYLAIRREDWKEAEYLIDKCLETWPRDENAWNVLALINRKRGNQVSALKILETQIALDPLNHTARFEKYLNTGSESDKIEFTSLIRQELPHETYIETAIRYFKWNLEEEALRLLELAPAHPMVHLWQAFLLDKAGQKEAVEKYLSLAVAGSPELVFPFRPEETGVFSWANQRKPSWKWRYYEALVYWQNNRTELAKQLFISCGTEPDFAPFYLTKAGLFRDESEIVRASLEEAYRIDPASWRTGLELSRFYSQNGMIDRAVLIAGKNLKIHSDSYVAGLQYAQVLRLNGRYAESLGILDKLEMLPAEGQVDAHSLFRETNILYSLELMKAGKWGKALVYLRKSETWPENLGSGEPYITDNRLTQLFQAYCNNKLNNRLQTDRSFSYLANFKSQSGRSDQLGNRLTRLIQGGNRDFRSITDTLLKENERGRDIEYLRTFQSVL